MHKILYFAANSKLLVTEEFMKHITKFDSHWLPYSFDLATNLIKK